MKHTKRLLAAIVAISMVSALAPMSAFAADDTIIKQDTADKTGTMTATYDVTAKYTVTIPAGVTLNAEEDVTSNITAENVLIEKGKQVVVTLTGGTNTTEGSTFHAKRGDSTAEYTISAGTPAAAVSVGDTVATFSNGTAEQTSTLTFSKPTGWTAAGEHTETLTFGISVEDSVEAALAPVLENGATMVVAYKWNGYNTTTFTFTNNNGTYSCNIGGDEPQDFSGSLTLNGTTLALSITNSVMSSRINLAISFDTTNDTYSFVTKGSWYNSHTVSVNGTDITSQLTKN